VWMFSNYSPFYQYTKRLKILLFLRFMHWKERNFVAKSTQTYVKAVFHATHINLMALNGISTPRLYKTICNYNWVHNIVSGVVLVCMQFFIKSKVTIKLLWVIIFIWIESRKKCVIRRKEKKKVKRKKYKCNIWRQRKRRWYIYIKKKIWWKWDRW